MKTLFEVIMPDMFYDFFAAHALLRALFNFAIVTLIAVAMTFVARKIVDVIIKFAVTRTKTKWDDVFFNHGVFSKFVNMVPALIFYWSAFSFDRGSQWLKRLSFCIIILVLMDILRAANKAMLEIYDSFEISKDKPLKGLMQIVLIIIYCIGFIAMVSILLDKSPALLLSGLGAMTAVIMLIFRDSILGFVAGLQIADNVAYIIARSMSHSLKENVNIEKIFDEIFDLAYNGNFDKRKKDLRHFYGIRILPEMFRTIPMERKGSEQIKYYNQMINQLEKHLEVLKNPKSKNNFMQGEV